MNKRPNSSGRWPSKSFECMALAIVVNGIEELKIWSKLVRLSNRSKLELPFENVFLKLSMHPVYEIRVLIEKGSLIEKIKLARTSFGCWLLSVVTCNISVFRYVEVQSILLCTIISSLPNLRTKHSRVHILVWCYFQELVWINISVCSKIFMFN